MTRGGKLEFRMTTLFCIDRLSAGRPSLFQRSNSLSLLMKRQKLYSWAVSSVGKLTPWNS